jgi:hypothetical protein
MFWNFCGLSIPSWNLAILKQTKQKTSINNKNMHQIRDKKSPVMRPNIQPKIYKSPVGRIG